MEFPEEADTELDNDDIVEAWLDDDDDTEADTTLEELELELLDTVLIVDEFVSGKYIRRMGYRAARKGSAFLGSYSLVRHASITNLGGEHRQRRHAVSLDPQPQARGTSRASC